MSKKFLKILFLGALLYLFPISLLKAEVGIIFSSASSSAEMSELSEWGGAIISYWRASGEPAGAPIEVSIAPPVSRYYYGKASASESQVSGVINFNSTLLDLNLYGGSRANYSMTAYAEALPNFKLRVTFQSNLAVNWLGSFILPISYAKAYFSFFTSTGASLGSTLVRTDYLQNVGNQSETRQWSIEVLPPLNSKHVSGGKTYYKLGDFSVTGISSVESPMYTSLSAGYEGAITNIRASYIGNEIKTSTGDSQTWLAGDVLPAGLEIKLRHNETGIPVANVPITYTILDPINGAQFPNGQASIIVNTVETGTAAVKLTLGTSTGIYRIKATCPDNVCVPDAREVIFTEKATGTALTCVSCNWSGAVNKELPTPFRLRVVNAVTGAPVPGAQVTYSIISFTGTNDITISSASPSGATLRVFNTITDTYGFSRVYLKLGSEKGTYIVRARCESCLSGHEQIARGTAFAYDVIDQVGRTSTGDPDPHPGFDDDCPSGCCPVTPVLRITKVTALNGRASFTSAPGESKIDAQGELLPRCLGNGITWQVADAPGDYIDSGTPAAPQPSTGIATSFNATPPTELMGRAKPLAYKITASASYGGQTVYDTAYVRQDEIDKCRQEYMDVSLAGQDLRVNPYSSRYAHDKFTLGVDGDYVRYRDCYAHVYPQLGASEVERLRRQGFLVNIQSGYRSARHNKLEGGVWNSEHQFGDAVDIQAKTVDGEHMKPLWLEANCPKILETMVEVEIAGEKKKQFQQVLTGTCSGFGEHDWRGNLVEGFLTEKYLVDQNDDGIYDILQDSAPVNGIADVFDIARVIHLGE